MWRIDSRPADIHRSDVVCKARVPAIYTEEFALRRTIGFIDMPTARTGARCVARINQNDRHANQLGLVFDKGAQLVERPAMQRCPLWLPSLYPRADALQIFEGDSLCGALSLCNDAFGNDVVRVGGKALFFARQLAEAAARRLRAFGLQLAPQLTMAVAHTLDRLALVDCACAINGDIGNAQVNAQEAVNVGRVRRFDLAGGKEIKLTVNQAKVGLAALPLQQFQLPVSRQEGDSQATTSRPNANFLLRQKPTQDARIIGNAAMWLEGTLAFLVQLVGIGNLADRPYHHLGSQLILRANHCVDQLLKAKLVEGAMLPSDTADFVARSIGRLKRFKEVFMLFGVGNQLHFGSQFHVSSVAQMGRFVKCLTIWIQEQETARFLPQLKQWASLRLRRDGELIQ